MIDIRHVGVCCSNLEHSTFFYEKILDLKYHSSGREEGEFIQTLLGLDSLVWVKLSTDSGDLLELYWMDNGEEQRFNHVAFTVKNVQYLRNKLVEFEIPCSEIRINKKNTAKIMFTKDPDNNLLELVENINEPKSEKESNNWYNNSKKREVRQKNNKQNVKTQSKKPVKKK